jgi:hypothetical protein
MNNEVQEDLVKSVFTVRLWMLRTTRKWIGLHTAKDFELVLKKKVLSTVLLLARDF